MSKNTGKVNIGVPTLVQLRNLIEGVDNLNGRIGRLHNRIIENPNDSTLEDELSKLLIARKNVITAIVLVDKETISKTIETMFSHRLGELFLCFALNGGDEYENEIRVIMARIRKLRKQFKII